MTRLSMILPSSGKTIRLSLLHQSVPALAPSELADVLAVLMISKTMEYRSLTIPTPLRTMYIMTAHQTNSATTSRTEGIMPPPWSIFLAILRSWSSMPMARRVAATGLMALSDTLVTRAARLIFPLVFPKRWSKSQSKSDAETQFFISPSVHLSMRLAIGWTKVPLRNFMMP